MKKKPKITKTVIEEVADNNDLINGIFSKRLAIANTVLYFGVVAHCLGFIQRQVSCQWQYWKVQERYMVW